ncbi:hypothetical protein ACHAWF_011425 [Thalassiosira exigua]
MAAASPSGRLPPQAPSSSRSSSGEMNGPNGGSGSASKSRRPKGSSSRSSGGRRVRSSSDGVRVMNQQYQQYQQHGGPPPPGYGYGYPPPPGPGGPPGGPPGPPPQGNGMYVYPVQNAGPGGPPPPPPMYSGTPPRSDRGRGGSFDANGPGGPFGAPVQNYGSIPPPGPPRSGNRSRTGSKEFSAMGELTSVMGMRGAPSPGAPSPNRPRMHRRTMSDSMAMARQPVPLPTVFQGSPFQAPPPSRHRADSYGSQHSYHSALGAPIPPPPPDMKVYQGTGEDLGGEHEAFLSAHLGGGHQGNGGGPGKRPSSHMRQNSVNLYMTNFKGKEQPRACRDVSWAVLFAIQLAVTCAVGLRFGPEALVPTAEDLGPAASLDDDVVLEEEEEDAKLVLAYTNIVVMACACGGFAVVVSALALAFMTAMSRRLVYVALVLSIGVSFAWGTVGIGIAPQSFVPVTGIVALMLTVGYTFVVWDRIPFASANLTTALTGVRDNRALVGMAFFFQAAALAVSVYYTFAFVGLHDAMRDGGASDRTKIVVDILLLVSYYWTYQVLRHIVMVTVAGAVGAWWFSKPHAIGSTFLTASVHNFGSVCYGSLFVGFVQFLRQITEGLRPNRDDSAMMCLYECSVFFGERIASCVDDLADSFNPWAFTYVGLYRYGLRDAGSKANELFEKRGWSRIVTDDLISSVLTMVSLVIGGLTGSFAVILQALDGHGLSSFGHPVLTSFIIGFLVGIVLSTVLFSIIESSVCAVIVCFASSPVEFHRNHPELSHEMRHAWKEVWPGSLDVEGVGAGVV